jgi:crossover junction endodeoxyribonuclease RusA
MVSITVSGRPVPAVRMTQKSKWTRQAMRYLQYKERIGWAARAARVQLTQNPVELTATFYLCGGKDIDVSNLGKAIEDALNKIAYEDDKQIISATFRKVFIDDKEKQRAEIQIKEVV